MAEETEGKLFFYSLALKQLVRAQTLQSVAQIDAIPVSPYVSQAGPQHVTVAHTV
jgi:hypothetical protein